MNVAQPAAAGPATRTVSHELASVDVESIAAQIAQVSQEVSSAPRGAAAQPARTHLMNLVVHAWDHQGALKATEAIERISTLYPSRSLIIEAHPDAPEDSLKAAVSAVCEPKPEGGEVICLEEVLIVAQGGAAGHVASLVEPLLVSDLPVFLLWVGAPPNSDEELLSLCDRLLVDSGSFPEPLPQLGRLERLLGIERPEGGVLAVTDLSWTRLTPWREMVAQFFDSREMLGYISSLSRVRVEYATEPGGGFGAALPLLLVSWLAERLGWEPANVLSRASLREHRLEFYRRREIVTAQIVPRARKGRAARHGEILGVELAGGGDPEATFAISRSTDDLHAAAVTRVAGLREITRTVPLESPGLDDLLRQELRNLGRDRIFEQSLALAARLLA